MSWLVDTNVISELSRKTPNPRVSDWLLDHQDGLFVSVLTLGELEKGLMKAVDAPRRARLERWIRHDVPNWFGERVLPIDLRVALRWGQLVGSLRNPTPAIDTLLAATAIAHQLTLVTRNTADLEDTGADLLNPWK
jgi:predicted nucleic acid-binding protein